MHNRDQAATFQPPSFRLDNLMICVLQIKFNTEETVRLPTDVGQEMRAYIREERQAQAPEADDRPLEPGARRVEIIVGRPHRWREATHGEISIAHAEDVVSGVLERIAHIPRWQSQPKMPPRMIPVGRYWLVFVEEPPDQVQFLIERKLPPAFDEHLFDLILDFQCFVSLSQAGQWCLRL